MDGFVSDVATKGQQAPNLDADRVIGEATDDLYSGRVERNGSVNRPASTHRGASRNVRGRRYHVLTHAGFERGGSGCPALGEANLLPYPPLCLSPVRAH